jgi:hypothetical protein
MYVGVRGRGLVTLFYPIKLNSFVIVEMNILRYDEVSLIIFFELCSVILELKNFYANALSYEFSLLDIDYVIP